jgi:hypothetical protein
MSTTTCRIIWSTSLHPARNRGSEGEMKIVAAIDLRLFADAMGLCGT